MKKLYIILPALIFLGLALGWGFAYAQEESPATPALLEEETVSAEDLGMAEPRLLPGSPFYFLKNITRGARKLFAFDPVKKAELELKFADEKIAEAKKVAEISPERTEALNRAVDNYRRSQEELKARLTALKETSQNPNVDRLLGKMADRAVKHEKLVEELKTKFEENQGLREKLDAAQGKIEEAVVQAAQKDQAQNFAGRIEKALVESRGSELKHIRSVEIIERIQKKAPAELKDRLTEIRNDFSIRLKEDLEGLVEKHQEAAPELIQKTLEALPGDKARRLVIIEEIKSLAEKRVAEALENTEGVLEKIFAEREEIEQRAAEALEHAEELILKLEEKMKEFGPGISSAVLRLAGEARSHWEEARKTFENKKFGEAFGQARSAEVLARNALRMLEEIEEPEDEDLKEDISEIEERLREWEQRIAKLPEELRAKAEEALENASFHFRLATESFAKGLPHETKKHLEEAKRSLRIVERIFQGFLKETALPTESPCPAITFPACERERGSEECIRQVKEVATKYPRCGFEKLLEKEVETSKPPEPPPVRLRIDKPLPRCEDLEKNLVELKELLGLGKISKEDFDKKAEALQRELSACARQVPTPQPIKPLPAPRPEATVCTQEYSPVCGINGKNYSNACHAKVAGVEIKYRGECAKPQEENPIKPLPLPSIIPLPYLAPKPTTETNAPTDQMR